MADPVLTLDEWRFIDNTLNGSRFWRKDGESYRVHSLGGSPVRTMPRSEIAALHAELPALLDRHLEYLATTGQGVWRSQLAAKSFPQFNAMLAGYAVFCSLHYLQSVVNADDKKVPRMVTDGGICYIIGLHDYQDKAEDVLALKADYYVIGAAPNEYCLTSVERGELIVSVAWMESQFPRWRDRMEVLLALGESAEEVLHKACFDRQDTHVVTSLDGVQFYA